MLLQTINFFLNIQFKLEQPRFLNGLTPHWFILLDDFFMKYLTYRKFQF